MWKVKAEGEESREDTLSIGAPWCWWRGTTHQGSFSFLLWLMLLVWWCNMWLSGERLGSLSYFATTLPPLQWRHHLNVYHIHVMYFTCGFVGGPQWKGWQGEVRTLPPSGRIRQCLLPVLRPGVANQRLLRLNCGGGRTAFWRGALPGGSLRSLMRIVVYFRCCDAVSWLMFALSAHVEDTGHI